MDLSAGTSHRQLDSGQQWTSHMELGEGEFHFLWGDFQKDEKEALMQQLLLSEGRIFPA